MLPSSDSSSDFKRYQREMVRFCLTKKSYNIPGISSHERVAVYRDLIFGGFQDALARAYPIAKRVLGKNIWDDLISTFVSSHPCPSPQLWQMPRELLNFVENSEWKAAEFPYLRDLLEFEWVEIEVGMMPEIELPSFKKSVDPWNEAIIINPVHQVSALMYPVFRMSIEELKNSSQVSGRYFLLTYRDITTDIVKYCELSPLVLNVLDIIISRNCSWADAFEASIIDLGINSSIEHHSQMCRIALNMFVENGVLLGTATS